MKMRPVTRDRLLWALLTFIATIAGYPQLSELVPVGAGAI